MTLAGTVLADRYRLLDILGEGGMAIVYRARDELLDRDVAVKILRPQFAADDEFVGRFRQEARTAGSLAHPNIAPVFDSGVHGDLQFIVMQLVDGSDLEKLLAEHGRMPVAEALRIAMAVAEALQAAHDHGLIHRDVKPGNILLTADGSVRVVDFGISRAVSDVRRTTPGLLLGSMQHCSPEQVLGEEVGPASDIYSLGLVLYELLTGVRPFDGSSPAAVALERVRHDPPPPSTVAHDLPAGIDELVMGALAREPAARYPSGIAFAEAIRDWWRASRRDVAGALPPAGMAVPRIERRRAAVTSATALADARTAVVAAQGARLHQAGAGDDDPRRVLGVIIPLAALLFVAIGLWALLPHGRGGDGGVLAATSSPARSAAAVVATSSATPSASASVSPSPTASPTASPTPRPSPTSRPTPGPTPIPVRVTAPTRTPAQTVARFYQLVADHRFSAAAQLWTARMRANYPPSIYINRRFGHTTRIVLNRNRTISMNLAAGTAVVAVDLTEYRDIEPSPRRWVGRWDLVLTRNGWLLDRPHF